MTTTATPRAAAPWWAGALAGLLAAASGVAVGTAVAALLQGVPSPIESVGNRAIDYAPPFLKEFAVKQFGTNDKPILIGGVVAGLAVIAMSRRDHRPPQRRASPSIRRRVSSAWSPSPPRPRTAPRRPAAR